MKRDAIEELYDYTGFAWCEALRSPGW